MRKKILGRTGIEISIVGLGGSALGIPDRKSLFWQYGPEAKGVFMEQGLGAETVIAALESGATLVDTAPWYGAGASELIVAEALRRRPEFKKSVIVTTKVGHRLPDDQFDYSREAVLRSIEGSQERLQQNRFRIVYLHDPMGQDMKFVMSPQGALGGLRELQRQGITDFIGVAANDPECNADYIETGEFDAAVVPSAWTLINQGARKRILPAAEKYNVGLVGAAPIERGLLVTGPIGVDYLYRKFSLKCLEHVGKIKALCDKWNVPLVAAALQWITRHPQFASAIPGAQLPEESRQNTEAGNFEIPNGFWKELDPFIRHWDFFGG